MYNSKLLTFNSYIFCGVPSYSINLRVVRHTRKTCETLMKEQIISDFDKLSNFEDTDLWNHNNHYFEFLKSKICQNGKSALEVGCGNGNFCAVLSPMFENVIGLDISPKTINKAKEYSNAKNVQYEIGDYLQIRYPENSFDLIVSIATVHHFSLLDFLRKAKSEIKSGGQIVILDLYRPKTLKERITEILAVFLNFIYQLVINKGLSENRHRKILMDKHQENDVYLTIQEVKDMIKHEFTTAEFNKHLFWRYSLIWKKL